LRVAKEFTAEHDAFWIAARKAHGDAAGTRALRAAAGLGSSDSEGSPFLCLWPYFVRISSSRRSQIGLSTS
jgi:hypothetical protein